MQYPYVSRNLLIPPKEHYMYAKFYGEIFLKSYSDSRVNFIKKYQLENFSYNYNITKLLINSPLYKKIYSQYNFSTSVVGTAKNQLENELLKNLESIFINLINEPALSSESAQTINNLIKKYEVFKRLEDSDFSTQSFIIYPICANIISYACFREFNIIFFNTLLKLNDMCISAISNAKEVDQESILLSLFSVVMEYDMYKTLKK